MATNGIQFQPSMSIPEYLANLGTVEQCAKAVLQSRWPHGFWRPRCCSSEHDLVDHGARELLQCRGYRHPNSLTVGSLMAHTKLPRSTRFLAIYLISQAKTGSSALARKRHLGLNYLAAWLLDCKINRAIPDREDAHRLHGAVPFGDAYLVGERASGKPGRASENKVPFVAAVSLNGKGQPLYLKFTLVSGFTAKAISQ
ncbi:MAG: hypothetical protein IIZ92_30275 [Aquincola sp.]|nr:hypothetical protein [Aquincola sp.]